jgi:hypothetical protein
MPGGITKEDLEDLDIVDAEELASDGSSSFQIFSGVTTVSTTSSTKRVVLSGIDLLDRDDPLEAEDIVILSGTSGADGTYTVDDVVDSVTFDVNESIADSTGGTCEARHPPGAQKVGLDDTGLTNVTADNVQDAITDLDGAISAGGITEAQHKTLRQLAHFIETNSPGEGFATGPYASEVLPSGNPFPTSETWFESAADKAAGTGKICRWEGTYNANKTFATETWIVYKADGTSKAVEAVDTISYSGVFETGRSRAITVY